MQIELVSLLLRNLNVVENLDDDDDYQVYYIDDDDDYQVYFIDDDDVDDDDDNNNNDDDDDDNLPVDLMLVP